MAEPQAESEPDAADGRAGRRLGWGRAALLVLAGAVTLALLLWFTWGQAQRGVTWQEVGFSVTGPDEVLVTYEVTKDPAAWAQCHLEALNPSFALVGVRTVTIGPAGDGRRVQRFRSDVPTVELATTGVVAFCELIDDPRG